MQKCQNTYGIRKHSLNKETEVLHKLQNFSFFVGKLKNKNRKGDLNERKKTEKRGKETD